MKTSQKGLATLVYEEGEVLKAYRCPAGIWTIGVGITSAAGVGVIHAGMQISPAQSRQMLASALRRNYEPRVAKQMPGAKPHEFDAGVLFDFNTGAIHRASWVKLWRKGAARATITAMLKLWNKGGGKVLPGLVKRRENEARILLDGAYPAAARQAPLVAVVPAANDAAVWALPLTVHQQHQIAAAFRKLGYVFDSNAPALPSAVVRQFQRDHDLTVDGIIGRATLSTLQRRIDAATRAKPAVAATVGGAGATAAPTAVPDAAIADLLAIAGPLLATGAAAYGLYLAWSYRDAIAAKVQARLPRVAAFLRMW